MPSGLDPAEAVSLILNYVTAYQMLQRSAKVKPGQRVLIQARPVESERPSCSSVASLGWRCTAPVPREGHRWFRTWAASQLITTSRSL